MVLTKRDEDIDVFCVVERIDKHAYVAFVVERTGKDFGMGNKL